MSKNDGTETGLQAEKLEALRKEYKLHLLDEATVFPDALQQFEVWFNEALASKLVEPNAMTLATATSSGVPSARTVLLKGFGVEGFGFFTNYKSRKGRELSQNPRATLLFYWGELERQVVIEGNVSVLSRENSQMYFKARPRGAQLAASVSKQSGPLPARKVLEDAIAALEAKLAGGAVDCPEHWGGYLLYPSRIEFWQGRENRLHDRIEYSRLTGNSWAIGRLSP